VLSVILVYKSIITQRLLNTNPEHPPPLLQGLKWTH